MEVIDQEGHQIPARLRSVLRRAPRLRLALLQARTYVQRRRFPGSRAFWESNYREGGTSGPGSRGRLANYKAEVTNALVDERGIQSIIDFGCGDGYQASLIKCATYVGLDVSESAIDLCRERFASDSSRTFMVYNDPTPASGAEQPHADMALSLDVIYHLVEDDVFERYMADLFGMADKHVLIYSVNRVPDPARPDGPFTWAREFSNWVDNNAPDWHLETRLPNPYPETSWSDFYLYTRKQPWT